MKTRNLFLTLLVVFVVATSYAADRERLSVVPYDDCKALVALNAEDPSVFKVAIKNDMNQTVYYEKTREASQMYRGRFDFSNLEDGNYVLTVKSENQFWVNKLKVKDSRVEVQEVCKSIAPVVVQKENKLNVSVLNSVQKPVFMNVYCGDEHVFGEKLGRTFTIQKRFDLSALEPGDYKVVITDWHTDYNYTVCK